jgi:hypothetical protein
MKGFKMDFKQFQAMAGDLIRQTNVEQLHAALLLGGDDAFWEFEWSSDYSILFQNGGFWLSVMEEEEGEVRYPLHPNLDLKSEE